MTDIKYKWFEDSWISIDLDSWIEHFFNFEEKITEEILQIPKWSDYDRIIQFFKGKEMSYTTNYTYQSGEIFDHSFQYWKFEIEDKRYVIIQIHVGVDARSGFYELKVYSLKDKYKDCEIPFHFNTLEFICSECEELYELDSCGYFHPKLDNEKTMCCGKHLTPIFDE